MSPTSPHEPILSPEQVLDCLGTIARCIHECRTLDDILYITAHTVRQLLQTDRVLISRFQPNQTNITIVESVDSNWTSLLGKTFPNVSLKNNFYQFPIQGNSNELERDYLELFAPFQVRASLVFPVVLNYPKLKSKTQNCLWGLLIIHQCSYLRQWQPLEVNLLQQVAVQLGIAIQQTQLLQQANRERFLGCTLDATDPDYIAVRDIEGALRESEEQFRQIFQNAPIAISLVDYQTHRFIQVNPAHYHLMGYTISDLASLTLEDISHPDDLQQNLNYLEQFKQGEFESFCMEKRFIKKNGEFVRTNITVSILPDQDGKPKFSLAMIEDITERRKVEDKIKASLLEKETLLKEIHHRVKNNLQIISSLLRLQSRQISEPIALAAFKESQNRVQAMALIHEKLYQSSNLAKIDFEEYIKTLVQELFRSYEAHKRTITFTVKVNQLSLAIALATPFGLIINELVSNSLKYAFPETLGGHIFIGLQEPIRGQFIMSISDNGIGLPKDLDFRHTSSLGLQLVCRLIKQLNGTIELDRSQGTKFEIMFATYSRDGEG